MIVFALLIWQAASFLLFKRPPLDFSGEKKVWINDNGFDFFVSAKAATVGELLIDQKVEIGQQDVLYPTDETKLTPGMNISIVRAFPVKIFVDGDEIDHHTFKRTVKDTLSEAGIALSHLDRTLPERSEPIEKDLEIVVTRINIEQVVESEPIKYKTIEKQDKKLKWRKQEIEQKGILGEMEVRYEITYKNGKQVKKEKMSSKIVEYPVDEVLRIGTKVEVGKTQKGRASWYAYTGTMACASVKFPKGTWLRVTSRASGKRIFVQVNDYGPDPGTGKIIDLDAVAFKKLAPLGAGVIEVKVEEILE